MAIKAAGLRFIPKGAVKVADKNSDAVAYLYQGGADGKSPCARVYYGKQSKPVVAAVFGGSPKMTGEQYRAKRIADFFRYRQEAMERKAKAAADRKAKGRGVEVGQYLVSSWGYDQTNVDFYKITALIGKTMAEIVKVGSMDVGDGTGSSMSSKVIPGEKPLKDAKPFRVVIKDGRATIRGTGASVWDGQPRYVSWYA